MKNLHRAYTRFARYGDRTYARQMKYTYTRLTQDRTGCRELTQIA